jgi:hypothetical protein
MIFSCQRFTICCWLFFFGEDGPQRLVDFSGGWNHQSDRFGMCLWFDGCVFVVDDLRRIWYIRYNMSTHMFLSNHIVWMIFDPIWAILQTHCVLVVIIFQWSSDNQHFLGLPRSKSLLKPLGAPKMLWISIRSGVRRLWNWPKTILGLIWLPNCLGFRLNFGP